MFCFMSGHVCWILFHRNIDSKRGGLKSWHRYFLLVWSPPSPSLCPFQEIRGILPTLSSLLGCLWESAGWVDVEELEQLESDADMEIQGFVWAHTELGTEPGALTHVGKEITVSNLENQVRLLVGGSVPCSLAFMHSFILFGPLYTFVAGDAASSGHLPTPELFPPHMHWARCGSETSYGWRTWSSIADTGLATSSCRSLCCDFHWILKTIWTF